MQKDHYFRQRIKLFNNTGIEVNALVGERLTMEAFAQLSDTMAGIPYLKIVVEVKTQTIHFIDGHKFKLHAKYIAQEILKISESELHENIDQLNKSFYFGQHRSMYLGILAFNTNGSKKFFTLETVEVDDMSGDMLRKFYRIVKKNLTTKHSLYLRPANHWQEMTVLEYSTKVLPRIFSYELMDAKSFIPLNTGEAQGRLCVFHSFLEYQERKSELLWHDIIVMKKVPDDIPRISGIINAEHTTPLSHTNVLACGWQIPNAIQKGVLDEIDQRNLNGKWVCYKVERNAPAISLLQIDEPELKKPLWTIHQVTLEPPKIEQTAIVNLNALRFSECQEYGTKAANLGEINYLLDHPSNRVLGFYKVKRFPREHLLDHLADRLQVGHQTDLVKACHQFLRRTIQIPKGISIPFSIQQQFLESSPQIQQLIGKIKMALELNAKEVNPLCIRLQQLIEKTPIKREIRDYIDSKIAEHLSGVESFVVRSSSNAEDLEHFSAAGVYESYNHVTTADTLFKSIQKVWASLVSPRSIHLRQEVGISLDDCYMGVVIQEEIGCDMGGVMVTTNPMNPQEDFRNVYINASTKSVQDVVHGTDQPFQILFNVVEGGGRTVIKDKTAADLSHAQKNTLQNLALAGKLLQSHFSPDYTYKMPVDIEWAIYNDQIYLLQIRPYAI